MGTDTMKRRDGTMMYCYRTSTLLMLPVMQRIRRWWPTTGDKFFLSDIQQIARNFRFSSRSVKNFNWKKKRSSVAFSTSIFKRSMKKFIGIEIFFVVIFFFVFPFVAFLLRFVLIMQNRIIDSSMRSASASVRAATSLDKHEQLLTSYLFSEFDHRTDEKQKSLGGPGWSMMNINWSNLVRTDIASIPIELKTMSFWYGSTTNVPWTRSSSLQKGLGKCLLEISRERLDSSFSSLCTRRCLCSSKGQTEGRRADICSSIERNGPKILFFHHTIVRRSVRKRRILQRVRLSFALSMNSFYA